MMRQPALQRAHGNSDSTGGFSPVVGKSRHRGVNGLLFELSQRRRRRTVAERRNSAGVAIKVRGVDAIQCRVNIFQKS